MVVIATHKICGGSLREGWSGTHRYPAYFCAKCDQEIASDDDLNLINYKPWGGNQPLEPPDATPEQIISV